MVASWQNHFHLLVTPPDPVEADQYVSLAPGANMAARPEVMVIAAPRRALNGVFRAHVLMEGANPLLINDWTVLSRFEDWAAYQAFLLLLGKTLYFIYNWHDPLAHDDYDQLVFFDTVGQPTLRGQHAQGGIDVPVHLVDASQV